MTFLLSVMALKKSLLTLCQKLTQFMTLSNSHFEQLTFLDTTVYKGSRFHTSGILYIKTHVKPTNKQLYVHSTSYHPSGCKKGIIMGEALGQTLVRVHSMTGSHTINLSITQTFNFVYIFCSILVRNKAFFYPMGRTIVVEPFLIVVDTFHVRVERV